MKTVYCMCQVYAKLDYWLQLGCQRQHFLTLFLNLSIYQQRHISEKWNLRFGLGKCDMNKNVSLLLFPIVEFVLTT